MLNYTRSVSSLDTCSFPVVDLHGTRRRDSFADCLAFSVHRSVQRSGESKLHGCSLTIIRRRCVVCACEPSMATLVYAHVLDSFSLQSCLLAFSSANWCRNDALAQLQLPIDWEEGTMVPPSHSLYSSLQVSPSAVPARRTQQV
jgi:hypothetical protein